MPFEIEMVCTGEWAEANFCKLRMHRKLDIARSHLRNGKCEFPCVCSDEGRLPRAFLYLSSSWPHDKMDSCRSPQLSDGRISAPILRDVSFENFQLMIDRAPTIARLTTVLHKELIQMQAPVRHLAYRF